MTGGEEARASAASGPAFEPNPAPEPGDPAAGEAFAVPDWLQDVAGADAAALVAIRRRERTRAGGPPGDEPSLAMEEPLLRLTGACALLRDLAVATGETSDPPRLIGLVFLASTMEREALRLHRLYFGDRPQGC